MTSPMKGDRPPRRPRLGPEGRAFRAEMARPDPAHLAWLAGYDWGDLDLATLSEISRLSGAIRSQDDPHEILLLVRPTRVAANLDGFDAAMIGAGLTRFGREAVPGDLPPERRPRDMETGEPASDAEMEMIVARTRWIMVTAIRPDLFLRQPLSIAAAGRRRRRDGDE